MSARRTSVCVCSAILALLFSNPTSAAPSPAVTLIVRVLDQTGRVVSKARVTASTRDARSRSSAVTDDGAGTARLENLLPGEYVLEVEGEGFTRAVRLIDIGDSGVSVDISLSLADVTEHVVVTATGNVQPGSEVSKAVTVVARDEIESRDLFSVADALRTVPGLSVEQLGGPGAFATVTIRGMRAEDTSILIDGVRFRDAASPQGDASAFISDLYFTDVDRLEILRGSGSSLYGTNAVAGVVNVISRTGIGRTSGDGAIESGSSGFARGRARRGSARWSGGRAGSTHWRGAHARHPRCRRR